MDADGGSVTFRPLNKSDEGRYTCRVNNDVGSDSKEGYLKVLGKYLSSVWCNMQNVYIRVIKRRHIATLPQIQIVQQ